MLFVLFLLTSYLKETRNIRRNFYLFAILAAAIAFIIGFYCSTLIIKPVSEMVADLDDKAQIDRLTEVMNKLTFEDFASNCLRNSLDSENKALIIFDIDNFKMLMTHSVMPQETKCSREMATF